MIGNDGAEARRQVAEVLLENKASLVAEFFKRFPKADPRKIMLVTRADGGGRTVFYITYKAEHYDDDEQVRMLKEGKRKGGSKKTTTAKEVST